LGLRTRVALLEETIRLYRYLRDRLKYLRPSVSALIDAAASSEEFKSLGFLAACDARMKAGEGFEDSWIISVEEQAKALGGPVAQVVAGLGQVLGASDLESQLAAIDYGMALLEARLAAAREHAAARVKLYDTLGVLAGLGVAVLIA
jgi:stage III sporulation protein AB